MGALIHRTRRVIYAAIVLCGAGWLAGRAAAQMSRPVSRSAPTTTRSPEEVRAFEQLAPEVAAAIRRLNAGDRSLAPTLMLWLGSEQDGIRLGKGTARVRVAMRGAARLGLKGAVPWLITIYDNPTADPVTRDTAAAAAIRIDPYYSVEFLREVLDDATLRSLDPAETLVTCRRDAAVALATIGDETARSMLVDAMIGYLDSLNRGGPTDGPRARNRRVCLAMSRSSDAELARRLAQLGPHYPRGSARAFLNAMVEQIRINLLPVDQLLGRLRGPEPITPDLRVETVIALGVKGGPEVIPVIEAIQRDVQARQREATTEPTATSQPSPTTTHATEPPDPATRPASRLPSASDDAALADACREAIAAIQARNPVPIPNDGPTTVPAATQPFALPGQEAVPPDAELRWLERFTTRQVHNVSSRVAVFYDPGGLLPPIEALVKDEALFNRIYHLPYGLLARIQLDDGGAELRALRLERVAPGELVPNVYVLASRHTVRDDRWEHEALVLRKLGRETTALVPNRGTGGGRLRPDARMMRALDGMALNDSVEATFEPGEGPPTILRSLAPYRPPIAARIVKFADVAGNAATRPVIELEIARKRKTYLLPADDTPYATLSNDEIHTLPAGADVKAIVDTSANPPALLALRVDGAVAGRADGSIVGGHSRTIAFSAPRERDFGSSTQVIGHEQYRAICLRAGLQRFLKTDAAKRLPADKLTALDALSRRMMGFFDIEDTNAIGRLAASWAASADGTARAAVEREILLRLAAMSGKVTTRSQAQERELRSLLTPAQLRQVLLAGGWVFPEFRPPPTTQPAKRP